MAQQQQPVRPITGQARPIQQAQPTRPATQPQATAQVAPAQPIQRAPIPQPPAPAPEPVMEQPVEQGIWNDDGLDWTQDTNAAPLAPSFSGLKAGTYLVAALPIPKMDPATGMLETLPFISKKIDPVPVGTTPTVRLALFILVDESMTKKIDLIPVVQQGNIVDIEANFLSKFNVVHNEFMNDNNLDMQWIKKVIAKALDCQISDTNDNLDYKKITGRIFTISLVEDTYKKTRMKMVWKADEIRSATYEFTQQIEDGQLRPVTINTLIDKLPAALMRRLNEEYEQMKAARDAKPVEGIDESQIDPDIPF